jgi:ubiquinone biosynthesis protein
MKLENVKRVTHVIRVLAKHGLGGVLSKYGFAWYLPILKRGDTEIPADLPAKLRKAMEELGGAYIKLGQLLSIRPDLVPQEYCDEFSKLLDEVPPEPVSTVEQVISKEFKHPAKDLFMHIDPRPLGSASVAQVHKARLKNGQAVAIKVQRPEIAKTFASDIDIIRYIASKIQKHLHDHINLAAIVNEFEKYTKKELNFTIEASHIDDIRTTNTSLNIVIPKVYWATTTEKVLTMEYLEGIKLSEAKKDEKSRISKILADSFVEQIFKGGTFHADLHPGNVLILKNKKLGLLDFGIVGHIDDKTRKLGLELYLSILERDPRHIASVLLKYGTPSSKTNIETFTRAVSDLLNDWWDTNPEKRRVSHLMDRLFVLCARHHIRLPNDTILIGKGMITVEATARKLDSHFNFVEYSAPRITALLKEQRTPKKIVERFTKRSRAFAEALSELPGRIVETVDAMKRTGLNIELKDSQFRHLGQDINLSSNRLSYAMICASLIMAGSLMIEVGPKIGTYSVISLVSLSAAAVFVAALFISIAREHTSKHDPHGI